MIVDTTHLSKDEKALINEKVGFPFGIFYRFKGGGIGSYKMNVKELSQGFRLLRQNANTIYANIELRPKGILIHMNQHGMRISWVVAYHHLVVYSSNYFSIHAQGEFLKMEKNQAFRMNEKFIRRLLQMKADQNASHEMF